MLTVLRPANPGYTADELLHQLRTAKASLMIIHPAFLDTARLAARAAGMPEDRIVFIEKPTRPIPGHTSLEDLIELGMSKTTSFHEPRFRSGEAKTTVAFLSFSSGTTGMILRFGSSHMYG
jgi:4-coumarate--CoA ligase